MGRQWLPRVTSLPRISTSSYLESNRRLSRGCSSVITTVATAPATPPRKLVCSIGQACQGLCAGTTAARNASIADLPRVEMAWRNLGELVVRGDVERRSPSGARRLVPPLHQLAAEIRVGSASTRGERHGIPTALAAVDVAHATRRRARSCRGTPMSFRKVSVAPVPVPGVTPGGRPRTRASYARRRPRRRRPRALKGVPCAS